MRSGVPWPLASEAGPFSEGSEGETSDYVRRIQTTVYTDSEVGRVVSSIKAAKASENHLQGELSKTLGFRKALTQVFLFDTGASVSIIGQKVAKDNQLNETKLTTPRNIFEASGAPLDIIGESEFFVKLPVLGKIKRLTCLVLRGKEVE